MKYQVLSYNNELKMHLIRNVEIGETVLCDLGSFPDNVGSYQIIGRFLEVEELAPIAFVANLVSFTSK